MARLSFRCDDDLVQAVDKIRGGIPRERWLRDAVRSVVDETRPVAAVALEAATAAVIDGKKTYAADPKSSKKA